VNVTTPCELITAFAGGFSSEYVMTFGGKSESLAVLVTTKVASSATLFWPMIGKTGGVLTSETITTNGLVTFTVPSETTVVIVFVDGPWASLGVNVIIPCALILALAGGLM